MSDTQVTARLQICGDVHFVEARTASPDEHARLWPKLSAVWPSFDTYQASTDRTIPLVILDLA